MSSSVCKNCGSSDIDHDSARGDVVCMGCGCVLETQIIVSEIQFSDSAGGRSNPVGQFVGSEGNLGVSRQITLQNGRDRIQNLAAQLNIPGLVIDVANRLFKMAVSRGLTKGRKSVHMSAACLFLACRMNDHPFLLLDFSDVLKTDVYSLGRIYLQLCKELSQKIPVLDPCIYLHRYAHRLEFGDKTYDVIKTSNRLVQRMKRDWMVQGRRPSGLCGAALLVAARTFDFNRTLKDIVKVVRIGENTLKKRLTEFEQTPSSQLTIDEFNNIDLEEEMDPPSFIESKRKAKLAQVEDQEDLPRLTEEIERLQTEIEKAIQETNATKNRRYKKYLVADDCLDDGTSSTCTTAPSLADIDEELAQYSHLLNDSVFGNQIDEDNDTESNVDSKPCIINKHENKSSGDDSLVIEQLATMEFDTILMPPPSSAPGFAVGPKPTAASLGLKKSIKECLKISPHFKSMVHESKDIELDLTGINDDELDELILGEDEVKIKTAAWMRENADFLRELKAKEEMKIKELADNPEIKKKRKPRKRQQKTEASSAGEAVQKILQEKKMSKKINYDALMGLNTTNVVLMAGAQPASVVEDAGVKSLKRGIVNDNNDEALGSVLPRKLKIEGQPSKKKRHKDEGAVIIIEEPVIQLSAFDVEGDDDDHDDANTERIAETCNDVESDDSRNDSD